MSRPVVKICGVTSQQEIDDLARLGVDYFGLVVDVPTPWTVSTECARQLAASNGHAMRATLIAKPNYPAELARLVRETGVAAIQLPVLNTPQHVAELRRSFAPQELTIIQGISHARGQFWKDEQIGEYLAAGAGFILIDTADKARGSDAPAATIPVEQLAGFRARHQGQPILLAGGITPENVQGLMTASGAVGIDVCSSVRCGGRIDPQLVAQLMAQLAGAHAEQQHRTPSLRDFLRAAPRGNQVIAYLTIGDPPGRFDAVVDEVLAAGALALELGFPCQAPDEGATLAASHRRALDAGVDTPRAMQMLASVAERHPQVPLVAVVQWPTIQSQGPCERFLDGLLDARAAAILPVGLPPWELPAFTARVHERGLQTVLPCAPTASKKLRGLLLRYCSGCLYVPRGRTTGGSTEFANVDTFCEQVAGETEVPMIVGVGVQTAADVADICRTPAKAAAVGSALVDHIARGGSAGDFIRRLLSH